jgi:competence protein ComGC
MKPLTSAHRLGPRGGSRYQADQFCGPQTKDVKSVIQQGLLTSAATRHRHRFAAFTRAELLVILGVMVLLILVVLPALANSRPRSHRVICANNLRQIGMGFQLWGHDHNDTLPQEVSIPEGGTRQHPLAPNVWLHLAWISNEVATPKIFLCPSDTGQPAGDFTGIPEAGYLHPNFANRATSYFLGHAGTGFVNDPNATIAGDRNVKTSSVQGCPRFVIAQSISIPLPPGIGQWTEGLHGGEGNILRLDGRVEQLDNAGLRRALGLPQTDNASKHIITPR